ncbi:hypothetical protein F53441_11884 [Fusarium austroafricanum]|uniref:Myb-like domain-containing protein n=1 Tax=Fusarium austroafricanum TaxID=2364996 RepID=A0A8H4K3M7_9HYPO|nr:hypothetical protein F53441_11884 [Fusarium austroafricanum]
MNSKNWNDRADKDLFFTILSVKNIGVISGSEWTTIGNHMRSLGYGFTNEGCRQHFQGLRRAQNKAETAGPNGDTARRNDPTMNPITRRPGPGRGRPRKQPPVPVTGVPGEIASNQPISAGLIPGPPNSAPPYPHPQADQAYGVPPGNHQTTAPLPAQAAVRPLNISPPPPAQQTPVPNNATQPQSSITYPSPHASETPQVPAHLHPLQHVQPGQSAQQTQTEQQPQSGQQIQPGQPPQLTAQPQSDQQNPAPEPQRDNREATDTSVTAQPAPVEQTQESHAPVVSGQMQQVNEDIDADADADGEADVDNDEPNAKRQRLSSPEPSKDTDMDDEAVLALAAHNGPTDFASDFATYGEA